MVKLSVYMRIMVALVSVLIPTTIHANVHNSSIVTPGFYGASETETVFKNPAELTLYENVFGGRLSYGFKESVLGGVAILHIPDFGAGDFAFHVEGFGEDFSSNVIVLENDEDETSITLAESGSRTGFTWAKKTRFFTVGGTVKYYYFQNINESNSQYALGADLGVFFTPFTDLYLGAMLNDVGGTQLNFIEDGSKTSNKISQKFTLTASAISGTDMAFSVGLPFSEIKEGNTLRDFIVNSSFHARKVFSDSVIVEGGYNAKDVFFTAGYKFNEFLSVTGQFSRKYEALEFGQLVPNQFQLSLNYGITTKIFDEAMARAQRDSEGNPWLDAATGAVDHSVNGPDYKRRQKKRIKEKNSKRQELARQEKIEEREEEIDDLEDRIEKLERELEKSELEDKIEKEKEKLMRQKRRLRRLQEAQDNIDD